MHTQGNGDHGRPYSVVVSKDKARGPVQRPATVPPPFGMTRPVGRRDTVLQHVGDVVEDPLADTDSNDLRAGVGTTCPRCRREIESGQAVQKMVSGAYEHQDCPRA